MTTKNNWIMVIGLEVHAQLKINSKLFSHSNTTWGSLPNSQASFIDLGYPGVLPVLNIAAVDKAIATSIALNAKLNTTSWFERKQYFYPDLPKGYQISQYEQPIIAEGYLDIVIGNVTKRIGITRAHLEEDAGKSVHDIIPGSSGIDLNRAGIALLEIVSEPDIRSADEAIAYLKKLHYLLRYYDICDGNMQEGSFRCDANVSVMKKDAKEFGTRCEIKNLNSFNFIHKAIIHERDRQISLLESGEQVVQQTRLYDPNTNSTRAMRDKEEANDYRYFPDPDLLPVVIEKEHIDKIIKSLPTSPETRKKNLIDNLKLSEYDADIICSEKEYLDFYEESLALTKMKNAKLVANWLISEILGYCNKFNTTFSKMKLNANNFALLIDKIEDKTISGKIAKDIFPDVFNGTSPINIIKEKGLEQINDVDALNKIISEIIELNPVQVQDYKNGRDKLFGFFVGQIMKATQGKANPNEVAELLKEALNK